VRAGAAEGLVGRGAEGSPAPRPGPGQAPALEEVQQALDWSERSAGEWSSRLMAFVADEGRREACVGIVGRIQALLPLDHVLSWSDRVMLTDLIEGEIEARQRVVSQQAFSMVRSEALELRALREEKEEFEKRMMVMNTTYMLEITAKRDSTRASFQAARDGLNREGLPQEEVQFYEPLQHLSSEARQCVHAIVEEKIKAVVEASAKEHACKMELAEFERSLLQDRLVSYQRLNSRLQEEVCALRRRERQAELGDQERAQGQAEPPLPEPGDKRVIVQALVAAKFKKRHDSSSLRRAELADGTLSHQERILPSGVSSGELRCSYQWRDRDHVKHSSLSPFAGQPLCTGFKISAMGSGCPPTSIADDPTADNFQFVCESYNGNSWGTLSERLARSSALVLLAQEIGITAEDVGDKTAKALGIGWHMLCTPSVPCDAGQTSAGVTIFARTSIGLRWPPHLPRGVLVEHRLLFAMLDIPGWPPILAGCAYLCTTEGLSKRNLELLKLIGETLQGAHMAIFGADWNLGPTIIEFTGLLRKADMLILQPKIETCVTAKSHSRIDFFVVSSAVAKMVDKADVVKNWRPQLLPYCDAHPRKYWAFGAGKSAEAEMWKQAVKAEAQVAEGGVTGVFSWDGTKYYESFRLTTLRDRSLQAGLSPIVVKVTRNFWRGPRVLRLGSDHSLSPMCAKCGLPAGSCLNDINVKVYAMVPFDGFVARNPAVDLASYVDDDTVSACGSADHVVQVLGQAAEDLERVFKEDLGVGLAPDKLMTFGSTPDLSLRVGRRLGTLAGTVGAHVVSLGVSAARTSTGVKDSFIQRAREGGHNFYAGLKFVNPVKDMPPLSDQHEPYLYSAEGQRMDWADFDTTDLNVAGGGSCFPHQIRDLSRAAFSWVFMGRDGEQEARAKD
ncbi:unnamed protein product, partial [Prorocentrum cordatum]